LLIDQLHSKVHIGLKQSNSSAFGSDKQLLLRNIIIDAKYIW